MSRLEKLKKKLSEAPHTVRFGELARVLLKPHAGRSFCAEVDVKRVIALLEQQESANEE